MGSKNRRAKAVRAALVANSTDTSKLPVWEVTNTEHLGVGYGSTSTPAPSTQMLHIALADRDHTLPTPAQAQLLQEIEPTLLREIKAKARNRGHEVGFKEGQRVGFLEGMEAGMKKGLEQGHREGHREGRFSGFRDGYQAGQLEVSQPVRAPSCPQLAIAEPARDAAAAFISPTPTATTPDIAAVPLPTTTSPALVLAAIVTLADTLAARDSRNPTPAPTQQPHEADTSNARSAPSASSIATHITSARSGDEPASLSHPAPTSATAREPDTPPVTTKRESCDVRTVNTHPAFPIASLASHTASASPHTAPTSPSNPAPPFAIARELARPPTATNRESREVAVNTHAAPTASNTPTADPDDSRPPPERPIHPSAAENEMKEGSGPRTEDVRTVSNAQRGHARPVRTPGPPASYTHGATPHGIPAQPSSTTYPSATADEPRSRRETRADDEHPQHARVTPYAPPSAQRVPQSAPHVVHTPVRTKKQPPTPGFEPGQPHEAAAYEPHEDAAATRTTTSRDSTRPPRRPTHRYTAANEPAALAGARPGDTHGTRGTNAPPTSRTRTAPMPDVPASAHNGAQTPAPGFEPGMPHAAAASFLKDVDPALPEPMLATSRTSFSWADDCDSLPIVVASSPCLPAPRDFSVLRSDFATRPFSSLQHRARRSHRRQPYLPRSHISRPAVSSGLAITHRHMAGLRAGQPSIVQVSSLASSSVAPPLPLRWDEDPRLIELSRVLKSLGWVRESVG